MSDIFQNITKLLMFTDIHFGARSNSELHNLDNLDYIDWFCALAREEKPSHIAFLGDWYENRNQINIRTLNFSHEGARRLNELNIPIIFIIGNHDLYHRSNRKIFSTDPFSDLRNFHLVAEPIELNKDWFVSPYLFKQEYPELAAEINSHRFVLGHFEFRNFVVTGSDRKIEHGPDPEQFSGPEFIFSGHFHKRQANKNIIYIGNVFPTNYGDQGDKERGAAIFDVAAGDVSFIDWPGAPLFFKTRLTRVLAGDMDWPPKSRVRCLLDADVSYTEVQAMREELIKGLQLREFSVEEDAAAKREALEEGLEVEDGVDLAQLGSTVRTLLLEGVSATPTISPQTLVELYEELQ